MRRMQGLWKWSCDAKTTGEAVSSLFEYLNNLTWLNSVEHFGDLWHQLNAVH